MSIWLISQNQNILCFIEYGCQEEVWHRFLILVRIFCHCCYSHLCRWGSEVVLPESGEEGLRVRLQAVEFRAGHTSNKICLKGKSKIVTIFSHLKKKKLFHSTLVVLTFLGYASKYKKKHNYRNRISPCIHGSSVLVIVNDWLCNNKVKQAYTDCSPWCQTLPPRHSCAYLCYVVTFLFFCKLYVLQVSLN